MVSVDDWPLDGSIENLLDGVPTLGGNLDGLNLQLRKAEMKIRQEQIKVANRANQLSQALIESNERASKQNEENAKQMNSATQALAQSTNWLKWATWALVAFTAVQAAIAFAALFKKQCMSILAGRVCLLWKEVDAAAIPIQWEKRNLVDPV
jgi:uncharacterized membrane protein YgcG